MKFNPFHKKTIVFLPALSAGVYAAVPSFRCPSVAGTQLQVSQQHVEIANYDKGLCALAISGADDSEEQKSPLIPIARSYDGNDWEVSAGQFAGTLTIDCSLDISNHCKMVLPALADGKTYVLASFEPYLDPANNSNDQQAEIVRFLEQATFGAQQNDVDNWNTIISSQDSFEAWIKDQMENPLSSHREFFRKRANPQIDQTVIAGNPGPNPCDVGARWRSYAFTAKDTGKTLVVESVHGDGAPPFALKINGHVRTYVEAAVELIPFDDWDATTDPAAATDISLETPYTICGDEATFYQKGIGSPVRIKPFGSTDDDECLQISDGNPPVHIPSSELDGVDILDFGLLKADETSSALKRLDDHSYFSEYWQHAKDDDDYVLMTGLEQTSCSDFDFDRITSNDKPIFGQFQRDNEHVFVVFDPRLVLLENTIMNPIPDGGGSHSAASETKLECANVPRSFLNQEHCFLSTSTTACNAKYPPSFSVRLDETFLSTIFQTTGRYVYSIDGLPLNNETFVDKSGKERLYLEPPCGLHKNRWSRWMRVGEELCATRNYRIVGEQTEEAFALLLQPMLEDMTDTPPLLKDVQLYQTQECDREDREKPSLGHIQGLDGQCWEHVHPLHLNVYDFSSWVHDHPGGADMISRPAYDQLTRLTLPISHQSDGNMRFYTTIHASPSTFSLLGRLGDLVPFSDLPEKFQIKEIEERFGLVLINEAGSGVVVCGSEGEVANDPTQGSSFHLEYFDDDHFSDDPTPSSNIRRQKNTVWSHIALFGGDQLRQRVAFALSQILVISPSLLVDEHGTETSTSYYDIFVRNAFGNYRDILKQVAFHDKMGEMLSSLNSKSVQYSIDYGQKAYPDENFAREVMQLFSIGLVELEQDGIPTKDVYGKMIHTYANSDVLSFARAWTGFQRQQSRGNYENRFSAVDPMVLNGRKRDPFPKSSLNNGYIGDRYPLCSDSPQHHFLRTGAVYRLLGSRSLPELQQDREDWARDPETVRLRLNSTSPLHAILCAQNGSDECTFPGMVTLDANLDYSGSSSQQEMAADTLRVVQLQSAPIPIFYEYVRSPCVQQAFFEDAKRVMDYASNDGVIRNNMCADPRVAVAVESCCDQLWWEDGSFPLGYKNCMYQGERMTYDGAQNRCAAIEKVACDYSQMRPWKAGVCAKDVWSTIEQLPIFYHWTSSSCSIQAKINADREIAIVHKTPQDHAGVSNVPSSVGLENHNFFKAQWNANSAFPNPQDNCNQTASSCSMIAGTCVCDTLVIEEAVFNNASSTETNHQNMLLQLHIGAFDPAIFDSNVYANHRDCGGSIKGVAVFTKNGGGCDSFDIDTVFSLRNEDGDPIFLKNMASTVHIGKSQKMSFRNPVHFMNLVDPEVRDAHYETDAVLDEYFHHPSHPPFFALRMIQRFGHSNPSPRYIETVANAYKTGSYHGIGSDKYGDMGALVAAILLDREARSLSLDSDPAHGQLREPLLKMTSFLRVMEYEHDSPLIWPLLSDLEESIGQCVYEAPSVFSFFLPDFIPAGSFSTTSLVSPEAQVLSPSTVTGFLDGVFTTVKHGIIPIDCRRGLATFKPRGLRKCASSTAFGDTSRSFGRLLYQPRSSTALDLVNEMSLLMTSSRLNSANRRIISEAIDPYVASNKNKAIRLAQQLIAATPEFHVTNVVRSTGQLRDTAQSASTPNKAYRAVVYLMLEGGMDSFNLLVPKNNCAHKDMHAEYKGVRANIALSKSKLLDIDTSGSKQPCDIFGINTAIPILRDLYNDGDALFMVNTGVLQRPVTKTDWHVHTKTPLFSHNSQQSEVYRVDIEKELGNTGVGGRIMDVLENRGYKTSSAAVGMNSLLVSGQHNFAREIPENEPVRLNSRPEVEEMNSILLDLNGKSSPDGSMFGEIWSSAVNDAVSANDEQMYIYDNFPVGKFPSGSLSNNFRSAAQWIKSREHRGIDREVIFVRHSGYDLHSVSSSSSNLGRQLKEVNEALSAFVSEMKSQGIWDNVAVVTGSDFGRTLTPNSGDGTDHGWGGIGFTMGGSIKGGFVHGTYPSDLTDDGPNVLGRGRLIPTMPLEAQWQAIAQWMGVLHKSDLDTVLPNRDSFDHCSLFTDMDLFVDGKVHHSSCSGMVDDMSATVTTGSATSNTTSTTSSCRDLTESEPENPAATNGPTAEHIGDSKKCECPSSSSSTASHHLVSFTIGLALMGALLGSYFGLDVE